MSADDPENCHGRPPSFARPARPDEPEVSDGAGRWRADEALAAGLAAGLTVAEAAKRANVSESTAYRRQRDPVFVRRVRELRTAFVAVAAGRLSSGMTAAADALVALLGSEDEDVRHRAAAKILELGLKFGEALDVNERLAAVEEALRITNTGKGNSDGDAGPAGEGGSGGGEGAGGENGPAREVPK